MFTIVGASGKVGGAIAANLLSQGKKLRVVLRDAAKTEIWTRQGAEIALADWNDALAMQKACSGSEGIFVMAPPNFAPATGYPEAHAVATALRTAIDAAQPDKIVALSSIGAHRDTGLGLIAQCHILEQALAGVAMPLAFVRPGWFMENSMWDIESARMTGEIASFLDPLDRAVPMVATADIGQVIAQTLTESWTGRRVIEFEGPRRYAPQDVAQTLGKLLGGSVQARAVPRDQWEALFKSQGTTDPAPRIEMLDGFNTGWIDFAGGEVEYRKGPTTLETVLSQLISNL